MMVIYKSQENLFVTRAFVPSLSNPVYLFELKNEFVPGNSVYFNSADTSPYCNTYRQFTITETGSTFQNLSGGVVSFSATGQYQYSIYEATASTLHVSATTGNILTTGIAVVIGADNNSINPIYL